MCFIALRCHAILFTGFDPLRLGITVFRWWGGGGGHIGDLVGNCTILGD